ncbi:MAG: nucleotide exchange factor GrpE [Thermoleophilaceae bacterium]|nr:nucleotide exchange factor GrpE [Thermoleophilaceae bacterium]
MIEDPKVVDEGAAPVEGAAPEAEPDAAPVEEIPEDPAVRVERERGEYLELAQRTQADFENYRRRAAKEISAAGARAKGPLLRDLLPVVDNLERAISLAGDAGEGLANGVKLVHSELIATLERNGVKGFEPVGEPFDPTVHEALSTRPDEGSEAGLVLEVVEKGYRLEDSILRPARVIVSA